MVCCPDSNALGQDLSSYQVILEGIEEASEYKYPPGLQVVKSLVGPSAGLGNLELHSMNDREPLVYPAQHP